MTNASSFSFPRMGSRLSLTFKTLLKNSRRNRFTTPTGVEGVFAHEVIDDISRLRQRGLNIETVSVGKKGRKKYRISSSQLSQLLTN